MDTISTYIHTNMYNRLDIEANVYRSITKAAHVFSLTFNVMQTFPAKVNFCRSGLSSNV